MQDEKKSTRNPSPNAFFQDFLDRLHEREEAPFAALECEARGPWVVIERPVAPSVHKGERWAVHRAWENPERDLPAATFLHRELAFLYAAGQEVGGRHTVLALSDERGGEEGIAVLMWTRMGEAKVVGHIRVYDEDTFAAFQNLETLLRAGDPLAQVLDAAGGSIVELVGRRLMA